MTSVESIALARAEEQARRVAAEDLLRDERDVWAPRAAKGKRVRISLKGVMCIACKERPAAKKYRCHRCYMRLRQSGVA